MTRLVSLVFLGLFIALPVMAGETALQAAQRPPQAVQWVDAPRALREKIVRDWLALPEKTRATFPIFRDAALMRFVLNKQKK